MSHPIFVSAVYTIYDTGTYVDSVWDRFNVLAAHVSSPIYLFCSVRDAHIASTISNVVPIYVEFETLETYKLLHTVSQLPKHRNLEKDTLNFMILMNAKTEFLHRAHQQIHDGTHYVWIDSGISKILKSPATIVDMCTTLKSELRNDVIFIPGCKGYDRQTDINLYLVSVNWRFCGGLLVVPADLVHKLYTTVLYGLQIMCVDTGVATWEVNVWAYMEPHLPILWASANHDASMMLSVSALQSKKSC